MTLRYFYQRSVNINLKFEILIFVIALTARLIKCDDAPTEAPAGGGEEATEDGTGEPEDGKEKIEGDVCEELTKSHEKCPDDAGVVLSGYMQHKQCIINPDDIPKLCALMKLCPQYDGYIIEIFELSVFGSAKEGFHKRKKTDVLSCPGYMGIGKGQMLSSSLWLIFGVVGGLMIYSRYD